METPDKPRPSVEPSPVKASEGAGSDPCPAPSPCATRIIGHGVDIVEVSRIESLIQEHGERFLCRCFTAGERAYAQGKRRATEHLAARFAAKEAVLKALGTGLSDGVEWTQVEVVHLAVSPISGSGAPGVKLHGRCAELAAQRGIVAWSLSLSHTKAHAVASAIATGT